MATLSFSPTGSISSHTLSALSVQPPPSSATSSAAQALVSALSASPHDFLQPTFNLHNATLSLAKHLLDPLASGVSEAQTKRRHEARKKRKRGESDDESGPVLQLKKVHLDGFGMEQVWEQSKRVLDAARAEIERDLPNVLTEANGGLTNGYHDAQDGVKTVRFDKDGFEVGEDDEEEDADGILGEDGAGWQYDGEDVSAEEDGQSDDEVDEGFHTEEEEGEDGMEDIEDMGEDYLDGDDMSADDEPADEYVPDPHGLNDGFFSIDEFNKQSEFLEQQDVRGDDDGAASDEEELNWAEDPLNENSMAAKAVMKAGDDSESEDEEDGPTFGNVDLNAPEGASDDGMDDESLADGEMNGMGDMSNSNNVMYDDFFAPPAKKANKKKKGRPNPHNFPSTEQNAAAGPTEDDMKQTMAKVHRDLFEDSDPGEDASDLSDLDPADPKSRKSTHERRQAKLAEEIRRLEAKNVAKREWTLSGEARAADRPVNSLLEENLEFERAGKPVPVITAEVSEDIEALIKRRILAREFDEVIRRRPDDLATGPVRRGKIELDDTKPQKGLAEEYEEEHLRKTDANFVDVKDEKLKKEHREIETLWRDVSAKLDALSSWHYKPKPAAPSLEIRTDAPTITMEDARPTAGGDIGTASMLAPQEVYAPGEEKTKGEVVTKAGLPIAKEEMSREQKLRRRRREKERVKKTSAPKEETKKAKEKKEVVGDLKRGGVKIIGRKGEIVDVEGKAVKEGNGRGGAGSFKL